MADVFFVAKGVIAFIGVILLVWHMWLDWSKVTALGQRLRYLTLFGFAASVVGRSVVQANTDAPIDAGAKSAFVCVCLLVITMLVSIRESSRAT